MWAERLLPRGVRRAPPLLADAGLALLVAAIRQRADECATARGQPVPAARRARPPAAKRYRSLGIAVLVHGVEGYFIVLILGLLLGWYP